MTSMAASTVAGRWPERVDGEWNVDLLGNLPDDGLRYEIIDGVLRVSPSPVPVHQRALLRLAVLLMAGCPPGHEVFVAPLDWQPDHRTSLEPDVMVVPRTAIGPRNIPGTPLLVVEVASPATARIDRLLKFSRYAEGGISQYWIVNPSVQSIEVFDLIAGSYQLVAGARGKEPLRISQPLAVTLTPAGLIADS